MLELSKYAGKPLSPDQKSLLQFAVDQGCTLTFERGKRPCTISVIGGGIKLCYINSSVIEDGAIVGYTFRPEDGRKNINGCPPQLAQETLLKVKQRFGIEHGWKFFPIDGPQRKGNIWYRYLHVMDFKLAKKVCTCIGCCKQKEAKMIWSHQSVYTVLVNDPKFSNTDQNYVNPYVCITSDQQAGKRHSMILYSPSSNDSNAINRPYQYDNKRISFNLNLQKKLEGTIESKVHETNQGKNWFQCKITDWIEFANIIGLHPST